MGSHRGLLRVLADAERHDRDRGKVAEALENPSEGVVQDLGVVHSRAAHNLSVHVNAVVEKGA